MRKKTDKLKAIDFYPETPEGISALVDMAANEHQAREAQAKLTWGVRHPRLARIALGAALVLPPPAGAAVGYESDVGLPYKQNVINHGIPAPSGPTNLEKGLFTAGGLVAGSLISFLIITSDTPFKTKK